MRCRWLDQFVLGDLLHAIDGSDGAKLVGQIHGQELISSGEHEIFIMQIPAEFSSRVARLSDLTLEGIIGSWLEPPKKEPDKGLLAKLFGGADRKIVETNERPSEFRHNSIREFHRLTRFAVDNERSVFLLQSP